MSFREDLWDGLEIAVQKVEDGRKFNNRFAKLIDTFAKETQSYARKLQHLCKTTIHEEGTVEEAWSALKLDIERFALHLNRTAADVTDRASRPIKKNLNRSRKQKNKLKEDGRKLTESLKRGMKDSDAAKLEYEKNMRLTEASEAEHARSSERPMKEKTVKKIEKKVMDRRKKSDHADRRYRHSVASVAELQQRMYDDEMPELLSRLQELEEGRLDQLKLSMAAFAESVRENHIPAEDVCKSLIQKLDKVDTLKDIHDFCVKNSSKSTKPPLVCYQPFVSDLQRCSASASDATSRNRSKTVGSSPSVHSSSAPLSTHVEGDRSDSKDDEESDDLRPLGDSRRNSGNNRHKRSSNITYTPQQKALATASSSSSQTKMEVPLKDLPLRPSSSHCSPAVLD